MADEQKLERSGYGASFNEILIRGDILEKRPYTSHGLHKLQKEIHAYKVFTEEVPSFPMATVVNSGPRSLSLRYYSEYQPLWSLYKDMLDEQKTHVLVNVFSLLDCLHRCEKQSLSKESYTRLFYLEVIEKVRTRYNEVKEVLEMFPFTHVNGQSCLTFEQAMEKVESKFNAYIDSKTNYEICYIHGDPQFSNILYNKATGDFIFIDPRGYFGNQDVFGIRDYDLAKVLFALSGYDVFDNMSFPTLSRKEGNIVIPEFVLDERYKSLYPELLFLLVSIWLANCHTFKDNPNKAIVSHAYARYLATLLL
jgi:hypothetical protein